MDEHQTTRKITNWTPTLLNRPKGRSEERWPDSIWEDLMIIGVLDWKSVLDRKKWQELLEQAKTHPGLQSLKRKRRYLINHFSLFSATICFRDTYNFRWFDLWLCCHVSSAITP
jgi:hypothetical protein